MIDSIIFWNEPNNLSHWNRELDPDWSIFAAMVELAARRVDAAAPGLPRVLGGISPLDGGFLRRMHEFGALDAIDIVAAHGFPFDWNAWHVGEWPHRLEPIAALRPVWVTEVGASSFANPTVQAWAIDRMLPLLLPVVDRVYWYALMDLPEQWAATTRHAGSEGSAYYRHYRMGVADAEGRPKPAADRLAAWAANGVGVCEWVYWQEDSRLDRMVRLLRALGIRRVRTGIGWADWERPGALEWFDHVMTELAPFDVALTLCFTPASRGIVPHHTSPPRDIANFAAFCTEVVERYGTRFSPLEQTCTSRRL